MKEFLTFVLLVFCATTFSQENGITIKGYVYDKLSNHTINNVQIQPVFHDNQVVSDSSGRFQIKVPKSYRDTLVFSHPDYFDHYLRVKSSTHRLHQFINLIKKDKPYDTLCYLAFSGNKMISGDIIDEYREKPLANATIQMENKQIVAYSDTDGNFSVAIPRGNQIFIVSHPDFQTVKFKSKYKLGKPWTARFKLPRVHLDEADTIWKSYHHQIMMAVNELVTGGIGIRYQYYFHHKHAVGLHSTAYLFGNGKEFNSGRSTFKGAKVSPYYRMYYNRNRRSAGFIEGKFSWGYFNFNKLQYEDQYTPDYHTTIEIGFHTFGGGVGGGWSTTLPKTKNGIFTIYVGGQYFPMDVPETIETEYYGTLTVSNNWWYLLGPGSYLEIKILFGGIF